MKYLPMKIFCALLVSIGVFSPFAGTVQARALTDGIIKQVDCSKGGSIGDTIDHSVPYIPLVVLVKGQCDEGFLEIERDNVSIEGTDETARINGGVGIDGSRDVGLSNIAVSGTVGVFGAGKATVVGYRKTVIEGGIEIGNASFIEIEGDVQLGVVGVQMALSANLNSTAYITNMSEGLVPSIVGNILIEKDSNVELDTEENPTNPITVNGDIVCDGDSHLWSNDLSGVSGVIDANCSLP